jgi:hypothetical protein
VAIAFLYTVVTIFIWHATWQNTKATREVLQAEHRPYVGIVQVEVRSESLMSSYVDVTIKNVGSVPSRRIEIDVRIGAPGTTREAFPIIDREPIALFPDQPFTIVVSLSPEEMVFLHRNKDLKALIAIRYEGATEKKYTTNGTYAYSTETSSFAIESGDWH